MRYGVCYAFMTLINLVVVIGDVLASYSQVSGLRINPKSELKPAYLLALSSSLVSYGVQ